MPSYRTYHDTEDLSHWIDAFVQDEDLKICYVAGHGSRGRLSGLRKGINLKGVAEATKKRGPSRTGGKGILLGACDVGSRLDDFLENCGSRIAWVAGYTRDVPWIEATLCDLLFLEYMIRGRTVRDENGFKDDGDDFASRRPSTAVQGVDWVGEDFSLAKLCGLCARDRRSK